MFINLINIFMNSVKDVLHIALYPSEVKSFYRTRVKNVFHSIIPFELLRLDENFYFLKNLRKSFGFSESGKSIS